MVNVGVLWDEEIEWSREQPFSNASTGEAYAYFSTRGARQGADFFFGKYSWYSKGVLEKAYRFENGEWRKVKGVELDVVFDKFKYSSETLELKEEMASEVGILNHPEVEKLCKDKLLTYQNFKEYVPETRKASDRNIEEMLEKYGKIVLKPRSDFGGKGIHIIESGEEIPDVAEDYIVQRFIDSSHGIEGLAPGSHDLRAIVVDGEVMGGYVRYNEESEISNVAQGGVKEPVDLSDFPGETLKITEKVCDSIEYRPFLISVDFFFDSDGRPWIVELNSKPGFGFYGSEDMKQQLTPIMDRVVDVLKDMA